MMTNFFKKKSFQYGTAAVLLVAVVLAVVIVFNVLLSLFSSHFGWYADISSSGLFGFSEESLDLLDTVDGEKNELTLYFLVDENTLSSSDYGKFILGLTTELENRYDFFSVKHFSNINKDLFDIGAVYGDKYFEQFQKMYDAGEFAPGTVILRNDTYLLKDNGDFELGITGEPRRDYRVTTFSINDLYSETTNAFLGEFVLTGRILGICRSTVPAYVLCGHGDVSLKDDGDFGNAELLCDLLENSGYQPEKLNLSEKNFPPDRPKASVAVIFAPRFDLTDTEIERLKTYIAEGGNLMVFTDGVYYRLDKLNALLSGYGIDVMNAKVQASSDASLGDNGFTFVPRVDWTSPVLSGVLDQERKLLLASCRLLKTDSAKGAEALLLPPASYTAVGVDTETSERDAVAAISKGEARGSVFVSGAATLASSPIYSQTYHNRDILLSVLADMGAENTPKNLEIKTLADDGLDLTKGEATLLSVLVSVLPALIVTVIGTVIFVRRKRS